MLIVFSFFKLVQCAISHAKSDPGGTLLLAANPASHSYAGAMMEFFCDKELALLPGNWEGKRLPSNLQTPCNPFAG